MKKYAVCGVGNALVDMEFEVDDQFLKSMGVEKGFMTLVDEDRQGELLEKLRNSHCKRASGGSAANTIIALSQFGGKAFYSCKVAKDEMGDFYTRDLKGAGVDSNLNGDFGPGSTGKCLVMVTPDAERTMNTFLGITADFSSSELVEEAIANSEYLYSEGYLITSDSALNAVLDARAMAKKHGVKVAVSFSDPSMVKYFKPQMDQIVGEGVDLLFCNETEAKLYAGTDDFSIALEKMGEVAGSFAVTRGADGAIVCDGHGCIHVPAVAAKAIDTNGAGDMFAGAFLYGITHGMSFEKAGKLASTAAARVVSSFGPRLDAKVMAEIKSSLA